ncbi:hypothetical protein N7470_001137 [Penicillium chermesinum]|nr:hypothetical protein N7470_001137 [Penicillium chermesinum]
MWQPKGDGRCGNRQMLNIGSNASEAILEALIFLSTIPALWNLELPWGRKMAVGTTYILGMMIIAGTAVNSKFGSDIDRQDLTYSSARTSPHVMCDSALGSDCCMHPLTGAGGSASLRIYRVPSSERPSLQ